MALEVCSFSPAHRAVWDRLVDESRNGTFLHSRDFMEYHSGRFADFSLLVNDEKGQCVAVMPASRVQDRVVSHGGLTYGGLIYSARLKQTACLEALRSIIQYYRQQGITHLTYKAIPTIFHRSPGQEDLYAVWRMGGKLIRRDVSTVVDLNSPYRFTKGRTWTVNKGRKAGVKVRRQQDPEQFHSLLQSVLKQHSAVPAHSLPELRYLMGLFPKQIQLYEATLDERLLAATLIFEFGNTVHTQYLANSNAGKELGALDVLIENLMKETFSDKRYFSFGVSTEACGKALNEGLIAQKEGFGGASVCHDFYELTI
jgi:hypothetical protein